MNEVARVSAFVLSSCISSKLPSREHASMSYARKHAIPASIFLTELLDKLPVDDIGGGLNMVFAAVDVQ